MHCTRIFESPRRPIKSLIIEARCSETSLAKISSDGSISAISADLPPGAAQASHTFKPGFSESSLTTSYADGFCKLNSPFAKESDSSRALSFTPSGIKT